MKRFENWLESEISGLKALGLILLATVCIVITYSALVEISATTIWSSYGIKSFGQILFISIQSMGEEVMYRILPIGGVIYFLGKRIRPVILVAVVTALYWGYGHVGLNGYIIIYILPAFILSIMYLKMGGYNGKSMMGLLSAGTVHILANISIFTIGPYMVS